MRTRTLLLLSIACGLLVLVSGGVLMWQLAHRTETTFLDVGQVGRAGDAVVEVVAAEEVDGTLTVTVVLSGVDDPEGLEGFTLRPTPTAPDLGLSTCTGFAEEPVECTLVFPTGAFESPNRVLRFDRADARVIWQLV